MSAPNIASQSVEEVMSNAGCEFMPRKQFFQTEVGQHYLEQLREAGDSIPVDGQTVEDVIRELNATMREIANSLFVIQHALAPRQ